MTQLGHERNDPSTENMPEYITELVAGGVDVILTDNDLSADLPDLMLPAKKSIVD